MKWDVYIAGQRVGSVIAGDEAAAMDAAKMYAPPSGCGFSLPLAVVARFTGKTPPKA